MQYLGALRRHYVVIPSIGLGYGRIPKAANSTIKRLMARSAGLEHLFPEGGYSKDRNWRRLAPHAYFLTAEEARRRFPDVVLFSIVREPLARLASCYRSKIQKPEQLSSSFRREGLHKEISFAEFVAHVASRADWRSNIHYRSQSHILGVRGGLAPEFIGRFETLREDLARLSTLVEARGYPPLRHPPHQRKDTAQNRMRTGDLFNGDEALLALARRRYRRDIDLFYDGSADRMTRVLATGPNRDPIAQHVGERDFAQTSAFARSSKIDRNKGVSLWLTTNRAK